MGSKATLAHQGEAFIHFCYTIFQIQLSLGLQDGWWSHRAQTVLKPAFRSELYGPILKGDVGYLCTVAVSCSW
jgi:hypothetical protein